MIWDFIRDFFVQYIFGGCTSQGEWFGGFLGNVYTIDGVSTECSVSDFYIPLKSGNDVSDFTIYDYINIGDWLSTTMTIICMVLISICFILLVRWLFKAVASAFLLK